MKTCVNATRSATNITKRSVLNFEGIMQNQRGFIFF